MIDITQDYFDKKTIDDLLKKHIPDMPSFLKNIVWKNSYNLLKKFRIYELNNVDDVMVNYDFLNRKTKLGLITHLGLREMSFGQDDYSEIDADRKEIHLYNEYARLEKNSRNRNLNYAKLEDVALNITPESFVKSKNFELCELQISDNAFSNEYIPAIFIFKDNFRNNKVRDNKNYAVFKTIASSQIDQKYDLTLQSMDEDYEIYRDGMILLRGKKFFIQDISPHYDNTDYMLPEDIPMVVFSNSHV